MKRSVVLLVSCAVLATLTPVTKAHGGDAAAAGVAGFIGGLVTGLILDPAPPVYYAPRPVVIERRPPPTVIIERRPPKRVIVERHPPPRVVVKKYYPKTKVYYRGGWHDYRRGHHHWGDDD